MVTLQELADSGDMEKRILAGIVSCAVEAYQKAFLPSGYARDYISDKEYLSELMNDEDSKDYIKFMRLVSNYEENVIEEYLPPQNRIIYRNPLNSPVDTLYEALNMLVFSIEKCPPLPQFKWGDIPFSTPIKETPTIFLFLMEALEILYKNYSGNAPLISASKKSTPFSWNYFKYCIAGNEAGDWIGYKLVKINQEDIPFNKRFYCYSLEANKLLNGSGRYDLQKSIDDYQSHLDGKFYNETHDCYLHLGKEAKNRALSNYKEKEKGIIKNMDSDLVKIGYPYELSFQEFFRFITTNFDSMDIKIGGKNVHVSLNKLLDIFVPFPLNKR